MSYDYAIGTSPLEMTNVSTLLSTSSVLLNARGMAYEPFSVYRTAVSGKEYGDGYPKTTWTFSFLTPDALATLLQYIGEGNQSNYVYIITRKETGTWAIFRAIMHRPKLRQDMTWDGGWRDVTFRFTNMEELEDYSEEGEEE